MYAGELLRSADTIVAGVNKARSIAALLGRLGEIEIALRDNSFTAVLWLIRSAAFQIEAGIISDGKPFRYLTEFASDCGLSDAWRLRAEAHRRYAPTLTDEEALRLERLLGFWRPRPDRPLAAIRLALETFIKEFLREPPPAPSSAGTTAAFAEGAPRNLEGVEDFVFDVPSETPEANAEMQLADGQKALREGRVSAALPLLQSAAELAPESFQAAFWCAAAHFRSGDMEPAVRHLVRAVRIDPKSLEARYQLASVLAGAGRPAEAQEVLEAILEIDPNHSAARHALSRLRAR
jgi:tetratricopeptide (TPR) repeat protein